MSFRRFQAKKKHIISFWAFLDELSKRESFGITNVMDLYPGLKEKFDRGNNCAGTQSEKIPALLNNTDEQSDPEEIVHNSDDSELLLKCYNVIERFIDRCDEMYKRRIDGHCGHKHSCLPISQDSNQRRKLCCILCCTRCDSTDIHKKITA